MGIKKAACILLAVCILIAAFGGYIWYRNSGMYREKTIEINYTGDVKASFEGQKRILPYRDGGEKWQILTGKLFIEKDWYPVDLKMSMTKESPENVYLYKPDGSYYATLQLDRKLDNLTLFVLDDESEPIGNAAEVISLKR